MTVSKTVRGGSSPSRDAKIWADSDNGSTVALQASGRGSIPRRSTKYGVVGKLVTPGDCKSPVLWHCWFKSNRLHHIFVVGSSAY